MSSQRIDRGKKKGETGISGPVSNSSSITSGRIRGFIGYLISSCPYKILGKKILRFLRGETGTPFDPLTTRELYLQGQIKIGFGIFLIGVFCPIFWLSFLFGARGNDLMFNAVHSGIVILFGILYFTTYRIQLQNEQVKKKPMSSYRRNPHENSL